MARTSTKSASAAGDEGKIRLPQTLTFKDLASVVSIAVSLALAWGVFSTRIAVLEQEVLDLHKVHERDIGDMDKLQQQVDDLSKALTNHMSVDNPSYAQQQRSNQRSHK
jgi:hypothetical protein